MAHAADLLVGLMSLAGDQHHVGRVGFAQRGGNGLGAIGLDPASESRDIQGVKQPGWSLCRWNDRDVSYFVTIFATGTAIDSILTNERFTDVTPIEINGREAFTVRETSDKRNEHCDVVDTAGPDALMLRTDQSKGLPPSESPCPQAIKSAQGLEPVLPR